MSEIPNPYSKTTVSWGRSQGQINELLREYGCQSMRWTEMSKNDAVQFLGATDFPVVVLEFNAPNQIIAEETKQRRTRRSKKPEPPKIRNRGPVKVLGVRAVVPIPTEEMRSQMYRALYYWLKNKLAGVQFGFHTFEQEFFAFLLLDDGKTIYEKAGGNAISGELNKLPARNVLALGDGK